MANQTQQDPATPATPSQGLAETPSALAIGDLRGRMSEAVVLAGGDLPPAARIALVMALALPSPVDAAIALLDRLDENRAALDRPLRARLVEIADLVAANAWHGAGERALGIAARERAALAGGETAPAAPLPVSPDPEGAPS